MIKWRHLTEAATLPTYIWEVPGSNLKQGTGSMVMSRGLVHLHNPSKKKDKSQSTQPATNKFFSCLQSPIIHTFDNIKYEIQHVKMN